MMCSGAMREPVRPMLDHAAAGITVIYEEKRSLLQQKAGHQIVRQRTPLPSSVRVAVKDKRHVSFVNTLDIVSIEAQGNYVLLHRRSGSVMLREAISSIAGKLEPYGFIRIHRSVLINVVHVESVEIPTTGDYQVFLFGGRRYTITRSYRANLPDLAAVWIGSSALRRQSHPPGGS